MQKGDPKQVLAIFNTGLKNVQASGEYNKIYEKWIGPKPAAAGAEDPCAYGGEIKSIEAVDDMTVKFSLCYPDPAFPAKAADTTCRSGRQRSDRSWQAPPTCWRSPSAPAPTCSRNGARATSSSWKPTPIIGATRPRPNPGLPLEPRGRTASAGAAVRQRQRHRQSRPG